MDKLGTILSAWFKQAHIPNASIDGSHLNDKA
jgi:hypothetical protein